MRSVGIRELRARLSECVERASQGERIVITRRGVQVAVLGPVGADRKRIEHLVREASAKWDGGKPEGLAGETVRGGAVADTVIQDRR